MNSDLNYSSYLICHEHVKSVRDFLINFFEEIKGKYNHDDWVSFKIPNTDCKVNLMKGSDQELTQNVVFEISCRTMEQLNDFSKKYNIKIDNFVATETGNPYNYSYIQIPGPANICKIEVSYI